MLPREMTDDQLSEALTNAIDPLKGTVDLDDPPAYTAEDLIAEYRRRHEKPRVPNPNRLKK